MTQSETTDPVVEIDPDDDRPVDGPLPLTPKEELFCRAFSDPESDSFGNATQAAAKAQYAEPWNASWKLRRRPRIVARLAQYHEAVSAGLGRAMASLEHVRLLAEAKGDLATAARCCELQAKRHGAFLEQAIFAITLPKHSTYTEQEQLEGRRIAAALLLGEISDSAEPMLCLPSAELEPVTIPAERTSQVLDRIIADAQAVEPRKNPLLVPDPKTGRPFFLSDRKNLTLADAVTERQDLLELAGSRQWTTGVSEEIGRRLTYVESEIVRHTVTEYQKGK